MNFDLHSQLTAWRIVVFVFLLSWLSQIPYLFSVPELTNVGSSDVIEATKATGWLISAGLVVFGLVASIAAMAQKPPLSKVGLVMMLLSSATYVAVWWNFSGYFDVNISVTKLFADLWAAAVGSGRRLIFVHLDVVLLSYYHLMLLALLFEAYRRRQHNAEI